MLQYNPVTYLFSKYIRALNLPKSALGLRERTVRVTEFIVLFSLSLEAKHHHTILSSLVLANNKPFNASLIQFIVFTHPRVVPLPRGEGAVAYKITRENYRSQAP